MRKEPGSGGVSPTNCRQDAANTIVIIFSDLNNDPWEQNNLAGSDEYAKVVEEMKQQLKAGWKGALPDKAGI